MPTAFVFITTEPASMPEVLEEIKAIDGVEEAEMVYGVYDIVVKVNVKNLEQLHNLTSQLHKVNGVERTNTQVIEKECKSLSR